MGETSLTLPDGSSIPRDGDWDREVRMESARAMLDRARRATPIGAGAMLLICILAALTKNPAVLAIPIGLRVASYALSVYANIEVSKAIGNEQRLHRAEKFLAATLIISGITWGILLYPFEGIVMVDPPVLILRGGVMLMVATVAITYASLRYATGALLTSFTATALLIILIAPPGGDLPPMMAPGIVILSGGIWFYARAAGEQATELAEKIVENRQLGERLAEALAEADFLARRDPLTGTLNRRAFFQDDWETEAGGVASHVVAIDLDHFKTINDRLGHAGGDRVLVEAAQAMRDTMREMDGGNHRAARIGGEEFVVQLFGLTDQKADAFAEVLRARIAAIETHGDNGDTLPVSASIGISRLKPGGSLDKALRRSDKALYRAKDRGRNRVESTLG